jgi:hypothetical protein
MDDTELKAGRLAAPSDAARATDAGTAGGRLSRKQARAAAKAARRAARAGDESPEHAALDTSDPRFAALFTRPEFALDPTDPRMKGMRAADTIRAETKRRTQSSGKHGSGAGELDLAAAVNRLKRKAVT